MKKLIAVILSLMMMLCAVSAMAESTNKVKIGTVSINGEFTLQCGIPEGYEPVPCNSKDDSNTYVMTYKKTLEPGDVTKEKDWKTVNFKLPDSPTVHEYVVKVTEFEIDHDWIKVIRKNNQPTQKCPVHL